MAVMQMRSSDSATARFLDPARWLLAGAIRTSSMSTD
jgi:hypothetical protein